MVIGLLGSPTLPAHLEMFNHVEAASMLCETSSVTSDVSSTDNRDILSQDIARDLGVTPLVSIVNCKFNVLHSLRLISILRKNICHRLTCEYVFLWAVIRAYL